MTSLTALRFAVATAIVASFLGAATFASPKSAATMARAATQFLGGLSPEQKAKAALPFDSDDRLRWHFIPNEMFQRKGLMIKDMSEAQRRLAHDLLRSGLSARGYNKVTAIIELEDILRAVETGGKMARDKEEYLFSVFGSPSAKGNWGWRVEGHHISIRFTIADGAVNRELSSTPMFLGANPAEVRDGDKKGLRVLAEEEDAARALVTSLTAAQRQAAIINAVAPTDIVTANKNDITPLPDQGVTYASLTGDQRKALMRVIEAYATNMETDIAAERINKIKKAGVDKIRFAWAGETDKGKKHYYMVQGPTFLIEFDNTQNNGNHIHSVWRDFNGDFGRDLLREHLRQVAH